MSLSSAMYNHLSNVAAVTALVSTRIYTNAAQDGVALPYIVQTQASTRRFPDVGGSSGMARSRWQLDCFGVTPDSAQSVADALRTALDGWRNTVMGTELLNVLSINLEEDRHSYSSPNDASEIGVHKVSLDFAILYAESIPTF